MKGDLEGELRDYGQATRLQPDMVEAAANLAKANVHRVVASNQLANVDRAKGVTKRGFGDAAPIDPEEAAEALDQARRLSRKRKEPK